MRWEKQWFRQFISIKRFVKRIRSCSIYVDIPPNRFSCPKKEVKCSSLYDKSKQTIFYKIHDSMHFGLKFSPCPSINTVQYL